MAVLEETGLGASIRVDGKDLQEWPDPDPPKFKDAGPQTKIVSRYTISQDDREYVIHYSVTDRYKWMASDRAVISCKPTIDGKRIDGRVIRRCKSSLGGEIEGHEHYNADGTGNLYKLKFSGIKTVDEATKARIDYDLKQVVGLGQVEVRFWRALEDGKGPCHASSPRKGVPSEIAEKALKGKAISHGTSYSKSQPIKGIQQLTYTTNSESHPMAIFVFKYRSKAALQQEMIIPRTPEPSPERERDGLEGMSQDEIRRLAQRQLKEEKVRFKRERTLAGEDAHRSPARPLKISRRDDGKMTIDLTDD